MIFTYKNLEFSVQMLYEGGHKIFSNDIPSINMDEPYSDMPVRMTHKSIMKAWKQPGDEAHTDVPRLLFGFSEEYNNDRSYIYENADVHVYNAARIRFNNIALSYELPSAWVKKLALSRAKLQFNVENVGTIAFDKDAGYMLGTKDKPNYVLGLYLNF